LGARKKILEVGNREFPRNVPFCIPHTFIPGSTEAQPQPLPKFHLNQTILPGTIGLMEIKAKRRGTAKGLARGSKPAGKTRRTQRGLDNNKLRKFAGKRKPPQWWYEKDEDLSSAE
jgi:hypothetical protein